MTLFTNDDLWQMWQKWEMWQIIYRGKPCYWVLLDWHQLTPSCSGHGQGGVPCWAGGERDYKKEKNWFSRRLSWPRLNDRTIRPPSLYRRRTGLRHIRSSLRLAHHHHLHHPVHLLELHPCLVGQHWWPGPLSLHLWRAGLQVGGQGQEVKMVLMRK